MCSVKSKQNLIHKLNVSQQGMASQVMKGMLKQAKGRGRRRSISIHGVPHNAVRVFIRLLYSSW